MRTIDLTEHYVAYLDAGDAEQYFACCPEVFSHYFEFWADRARFEGSLTAEETRERRALITSRVADLDRIIARAGFDCSELPVFLFVGAGTTNGHAFGYHDRFAVFLPIESYINVCRVDVFLAHEVFHALHYEASPEFDFADKKELLSVSRQLISEGLATYLSKRALGISDQAAMFADYIGDSQASALITGYEERREELRQFIIENYGASNEQISIFYAIDPEDVLRYKAGYYVGMRLVEAIVKGLGLTDREVLGIPRPDFERIALEKLTAREY